MDFTLGIKRLTVKGILAPNCLVSSALDKPGLNDLDWILEDELEPDDVAEAAVDVRRALGEQGAKVWMWLSPFSGSFHYLCTRSPRGMTDRFAERIDLRGRF